MGLFSKPQTEPLHLQLARKQAEYAAIKNMIETAEKYPRDWAETCIKLAGDIAVLKEQIIAEQDSPENDISP